MSARSTRIAILGFGVDEHVAMVGQLLSTRQIEAIGVDLSAFPARTRLTVGTDTIQVDGVELLEFDAFLLRQVGYMWPMPTRPPGAEEWGDSYESFADWMSCERESTSLKYALVSMLGALKPVVNPLNAFTYHQMKPLMYATLEAAGVPVPTWVAGNEPAMLEQLASGHGIGEGPAAVIKPLASGAEVVAAPSVVDPAQLQQTPLLYQRCVQGQSARAYVVHDQVVAAGAIERGAAVDWRKDARGVTPLQLEPAVAQLCVRAAQAVEMRFAALDLELTEQGPFVLDVNPTPMFAAFERNTGLDVAGPLVDDLVALARQGA